MRTCLNCNAEISRKKGERKDNFKTRTCCDRKCRLEYDRKRKEDRRRLLKDCRQGIYDYAALDECRRWFHVDNLRAHVKSLGFQYITEAIHKLYVTVGPTETARIMVMNDQTIWIVARKMLGLGPRKTGGPRPGAGRKRRVRQDGTLRSIADDLGVTVGRAQQITTEAMKKFKKNWIAMYGSGSPVEELVPAYRYKHHHRIFELY